MASKAGSGALVLLLVPWAVRAGADDIQFLPDWSTVADNFYPLVPASQIQPVFTAADVTDTTAAFVADPFLIHDGPTWYLFFEVTVPRGKIGLASSDDGLNWTYKRLVLQEKWDLSYPDVFQVDGVYYMTPESASKQFVRLYRAQDFPNSWVRVGELVSGRPFADPTVFRYAGLWWMFVGNGASDTCWLYYSNALAQGWTEHPASPIVLGDRSRARPGGRVVLLSGNRLYRMAQNSSPTYGHGVRVFQVDVLTTTAYQEHEIAASPILEAGDAYWNADGMHQCDPWWVGDHWLAAVDGIAGGTWSIGAYRTPGAPTATADWDGRLPVMSGAPNPFVTSTRIRVQLPAGASRTAFSTTRGTGTEGSVPRGALAIYDPAGHLILSRVLPMPATGTATFDWDGTDASGRRVPAGVYLCRVRRGDGAATTRLVRLQ